CCLFLLLALRALQRQDEDKSAWIKILVYLTLALLADEHGMIGVVLLLATERRREVRVIGSLLAMTVLYGILRWAVLGSDGFFPEKNDAFTLLPPVQRIMVLGSSFLETLRLLIWPRTLDLPIHYDWLFIHRINEVRLSGLFGAGLAVFVLIGS